MSTKYTYVAIYKGKQVTVEGDDLMLYPAQVKAMAIFQASAGRSKVKAYDVDIMLAAKDDVQVTHVFA